jgi:hypothetical protein
MVDSGIVYYHLVNFPAIWSIFGPFRIFYGILVYFPRFGILYYRNVATLSSLSFYIFRPMPLFLFSNTKMHILVIICTQQHVLCVP